MAGNDAKFRREIYQQPATLPSLVVIFSGLIIGTIIMFLHNFTPHSSLSSNITRVNKYSNVNILPHCSYSYTYKPFIRDQLRCWFISYLTLPSHQFDFTSVYGRVVISRGSSGFFDWSCSTSQKELRVTAETVTGSADTQTSPPNHINYPTATQLETPNTPKPKHNHSATKHKGPPFSRKI